MPKKGRNIYKRKDGRWEGRYLKERHGDGRIRYGYYYGKTDGEVREQIEMREENDRFFADVAYQWLAMMSTKLKPSTCACYGSALEVHILPELGRCRMKQLTGEDIGSYTKGKLETGRKDSQGGLSVKTVRDLLFIIKSVRDYAYKEGVIQNKFTIVYPQLKKNEMRVLTRQEQAALVAVLTEGVDIFKLGILLCLYTGLRVGEICALRWQDVSADYDLLTVRQTLQRVKGSGQGQEGQGEEEERDKEKEEDKEKEKEEDKEKNKDNEKGKDKEKNKDNEKGKEKSKGKKTRLIVGAPKSAKSERSIPVPKFLWGYLREFAGGGGEYLLGTAGMAQVEPRTMQNHFTRNVREAGIEGANYHSLRHTFATRCVEAGVDVKSLSEILGHANVNITLSRYVHSTLEQKRSCMERLEAYAGMP